MPCEVTEIEWSCGQEIVVDKEKHFVPPIDLEADLELDSEAASAR